jgi:hypothetical protein
MRTLLELFKILKVNKKLYVTTFCGGLCKLCHELTIREIINHEEYDELRKYIDTHKPKLGSKYYNVSGSNFTLYWPFGKWYPRILWINAQIRELSKQEKLKAGTGKSHIIANKVTNKLNTI